MNRILAVTIALALAVVAGRGASQASAPLRVLFVGNSLTAANDLPALVRQIGAADGLRISTKTVAMNDVGLEEHWKDGRAVREIRAGGWDVVVLQQGPSSLPESRVILRDYAAKFAAVIREAGARPALYMVWPSLPRQGDFPRVIESYALAAADVDAVLLPAGSAWRAAWTQAPDAPLYAPDRFHPSKDGSWLAALVIYCGLVRRSPASVTLPKDFPAPRRLFVDAATSAMDTAVTTPRASSRGPS
jgi:hypothetical protein